GNDRPPTPEETAACRSYLEAQIALIKPRALVALGGVAAKTLLATEQGVGRLRGRWHEFQGVPLLATYHPAALLRDPSRKRDVWEDVKELKRFLEAR
ncbi:MAG: uracil-DNA glycosylase, partial [Elusimicrobia bacterium]|nr:uracil-DNA glycosylase [Elusimicrobiota bacterium]